MDVEQHFDLIVLAKSLPTEDDLAAAAVAFASVWYERGGRDVLACHSFLDALVEVIVDEDFRQCMKQALREHTSR